MLVASIALIGTAIGYELLHLPNSTLLLKLGIMSLLMSVYMYLDVKDISLRNNQIVFNTYVKQIAIMLAAWMLEAGVTELLQEKRKKIAQIAVHGKWNHGDKEPEGRRYHCAHYNSLCPKNRKRGKKHESNLCG